MRPPALHRAALAAVAGLTALTSPQLGQRALASPVDLFGFGARGQALGSAIGADAEGFEAVYYNPAALSFERRPSFSLGYQLGTFDLTIDDTKREARDAPALTIGFGVPIPFGGFLKDRLAIGLGFTIPQTSILIADIEQPTTPSHILVENRAQTVSIQAALGLRLTDWLALGIGTLALAELRGDIRVEPGPSGRIGSKVKDELIADYALVAGLMVRLLPQSPPSDDPAHGPYGLQLALTYRGESRADFDLPIEADLGDDFGIPIPQLAVNGTAQYDPAELALAVTGRIPLGADQLSVHASVSYDMWSTFPLPIAYAAPRADTPPQPAPNFDDVVSFALGVEGHHHLGELPEDLILRPRVGFAFQPSPTPEQTGFHNHLDSDRMVFSAGLGFRWQRLRLDLSGQVHDLAERTHQKSADIAAEHPGFPSISHTGHILFFAIEAGVSL